MGRRGDGGGTGLAHAAVDVEEALDLVAAEDGADLVAQQDVQRLGPHGGQGGGRGRGGEGGGGEGGEKRTGEGGGDERRHGQDGVDGGVRVQGGRAERTERRGEQRARDAPRP